MNANARYLCNVLRRPIVLCTPNRFLVRWLALGLVLGILAGHYTTVHSWSDITVGTNSVYCGAYLPHLDVYCERAS